MIARWWSDKLNLPVIKVQHWTFVFIMADDDNERDRERERGMRWGCMVVMNLLVIKGITYPSVVPIISSACDEIISAINSSFIASLAFFHLRPPGRMMGRSAAWRPRKFLAFFCLTVRSSVTFCFNSADNSFLGSTGSCYSSFWNMFCDDDGGRE